MGLEKISEKDKRKTDLELIGMETQDYRNINRSD